MSDTTTRGIRVQVTSAYLADRSAPATPRAPVASHTARAMGNRNSLSWILPESGSASSGRRGSLTIRSETAAYAENARYGKEDRVRRTMPGA